MKNSIKSKPHGSGEHVPSSQQPASRLSPNDVVAILDNDESSADRIARLLSRAQVAHRLGVCPHTVQRLTRRGLLPAIVFNRRLIRYAPAVVEQFINSAVTGGAE
jgi:hypothetical protein